MQFFEDLGALVERRWRSENYDENAFPELASEALAETVPSERFDPWDVIRWVHNSNTLPAQQDPAATFGNPPITLYAGPRFHIDIYFWLDGTTTIHQHAFCGAFHVALGSSIHCRYSFEEQREINAHFSVGKLALDHVELLRMGDTRRILPRREFVHSLFHLDRPSATITIRTYATPGGPQYKYLKPYFAVDPFFTETSALRKVQTVSLLLGMDHPEADSLIGDLVSTSDFQTTFAVLQTAAHHLKDRALESMFHLDTRRRRFNDLLDRARNAHGELVDLIPPILEEEDRQNNLIRRRAQITGEDHRFFLALLLNVQSRTHVLELVKQRVPQRDPVDTMMDWVEELSDIRLFGSSEQNVLGVDNLDDDYLLVLESMLAGSSLGHASVAPREGDSIDPGSEAKLAKISESIRNSMLFKSLFLDWPATSPRGERFAAPVA
jgi:hypothetical protein